jgi:hypothetical protein
MVLDAAEAGRAETSSASTAMTTTNVAARFIARVRKGKRWTARRSPP